MSKPETLEQWCQGYGKRLDDLMTFTSIMESGYVKDGWLYYDASPISTPLMGIDAGVKIRRHTKPNWKKVKLEMDV